MNIKIKTFATSIIISAFSSFLVAEERVTQQLATGNEHYALCLSDDPHENLRCMMIVGNIAFQGRPIALRTKNGEACFGNPKLASYRMDLNQLKDIVLKYYRDNPAIRHMNAFIMTAKAISLQVQGCEIAIPDQ